MTIVYLLILWLWRRRSSKAQVLFMYFIHWMGGTDWPSMGFFPCNQTEKILIYSLRGYSVFQHNKGPIVGPLQTPQYDRVLWWSPRGFRGCPQLGTNDCREWPVSRTVVRLISVVFQAADLAIVKRSLRGLYAHRNLIKSNREKIVYTIFRLICNQADVSIRVIN